MLPLAITGTLALGIGTAVAVWAGLASGAPQTARVGQGTVSLGLFTSGTLTSARTRNLGFEEGGKLAALYVRVGDSVKKGQVLAKTEDFGPEQDLSKAQTQLDLNQIQLDQVLGDVRIKQSRTILERDRSVARAKEEKQDRIREANERDIRRREADLRTAQTACEGTVPPPMTPCSQDPTVLTARRALQDARQAKRSSDADAEIERRQDRVTLAFDKAAIEVAEKNRPAEIANARAAVKTQQAEVASAQRRLDHSTLTAPANGVVASITGAPGDFISGGGPAAPLAPGGQAQLPGVGRDPNFPGGAFMVLKPDHMFQMLVPVKQNDIPEIKPEQRVSWHPDALPDLHLTGSVSSVAPSAVDLDGPTYYATVLLEDGDPQLRDAMTTKVQITTSTINNVLVVPSSAVIKQGNLTFVDVIGVDGKPVRTQFSAGRSGFDNTEVLGGLTAGQQVVLQTQG